MVLQQKHTGKQQNGNFMTTTLIGGGGSEIISCCLKVQNNKKNMFSLYVCTTCSETVKIKGGMRAGAHREAVSHICNVKKVQVISVYNTTTEMSNDSIKRRYTVTMSEKGER